MKSPSTATKFERRTLLWKLAGVFRRCFLVLFALILLLLGTIITPPPRILNVAAQSNIGVSRMEQNSSSASMLEPNKTVEQEISSGKAQSYQVKLNSGQYVRFILECWGKGVQLSVYDPSDQLRAQLQCYQDSLMPVSVVADISGVYRLNIGTEDTDSIARRYQVKLEELRRATQQDQSRTLAEQAFAEAERLSAEQKGESSSQAIKKYEEARDYWQSAGDKIAEGRTLRNIGLVYQATNEYEKAFAYYNQALAASRKLNDLRGEGDALNKIGYLHSVIGNNQKALESATCALRLNRSIKNRGGEAQALHTLGDVYYGLGDLQKSLEYYRDAIQLWQQLNNYEGQVAVLVSFGYAYVETSDIPAALDSYQRALSIGRVTHDRQSEAFALRALGNLHTKLGENQKALEVLSKALEILETLGECNLKATVLGGLGYAYDRVGEKRRALEYYDQALAFAKEIKNRWWEAELEMTIGETYYSLGENQTALSHCQIAFSLFHTLQWSRYEAETLKDIGLIHASLGDKAKALDYYNQSLALTRAGQDQRYEAYTLNYIGRVYESLGEKRRALYYFKQALPLNRVAADPAGESLTLYNLARVERDQGDLDKARVRIEAALKIAESLRTKVLSQDLRAAYFASVRQHYDLYIDILMQLHKKRPAEGFDAAAFDMSERARARSLLESLKEARADIHQGVDPTLLERERLLQQTLSAKAERHMQLLAARHSAEAEGIAKEIDQMTAQYDEVKAQIKATSPHYAALTQPQPLSLQEIQQQILDDDSLMLEYALGDDRSYLWAVTRTGISSFELPSREMIEDAARRLYSLLIANQRIPGETLEQYQARVSQARTQRPSETASLSNLVLGPVATQLGNKRLLIVADGALQSIPFQALTLPETTDRNDKSEQLKADATTDNLKPLMFNHVIVNEPSASVLVSLLSESAHREPAPKILAVLADPVFELDDPRVGSTNSTQVYAAVERSYGSDLQQALRDIDASGNGSRIPPLLSSREEAEAIIATAPAGMGFEALDFEASRATASNPALSQYRIVHFATHGILNNEHSELSGLVLSLFDQQGQPQNGFLRLQDIYNLNLPVDLVVLSACNTGLGKDVKGEGLIGLTRGFMYAGASSVIASLWKVDDAATAELMKHFYKFMLKDGLSPADALRQSQLAMWKQPGRRDPYYWAGFVIQGQYTGKENLGYHRETERKPNEVFGVVAAALSLSAFYFVRRRQRRSKPNAEGAIIPPDENNK